jgi:Flp pilus assembly pilin Flp
MVKKMANKKGQGLVEYALLVAVVAGIIFITREPIKNAVISAFTKTGTAVNSAEY